MSWIPIVPAAEAGPALTRAYAEAAGRDGVANILGIHSLHPDVMVRHLRLYRELMFADSELSRAEREIIAVAVSWANRCFY